jgi:hypothetical protein
MLSSDRAAIRLRCPRTREKAEQSTTAMGIAITVSGTITVLMAKRPGAETYNAHELPISSDSTTSSISRAQRSARDSLCEPAQPRKATE